MASDWADERDFAEAEGIGPVCLGGSFSQPAREPDEKIVIAATAAFNPLPALFSRI
ncbi:MAG: hypothetical protein V1861_02135 [Candidatus Micrarchaeota archaeon]